MKKTVLISGGSGGIGEALAKAFAKEQYRIILHFSKNREGAERIKKELQSDFSAEVILLQADFSKKEETEKLCKELEAVAPQIDVVINNAAIAHRGLFQLTEDEKVEEIFNINLMSVLKITKEILPGMIRRQEGRIINISSMWGLCGASCEVHYSTTKAALVGFTKALAKEVGPSNITVNCIAPGFIDTKMNGDLEKEAAEEIVASTPLQRAGKGEDVAELAVFLASEKASFITGQVISADGGIL